MSSDGSRNGFLTSILLEVDRLIDTNYAKQYAGRYSVDKLAIVVGVILSTHLCGLLIIEEIQEKNFNNSKWHNDLTTFFLRILNFGIPTVLIGNPLGFTELEKSSQNVRRLSSGGVFETNPSAEGTDMDFRNLVDESLLFNVMERQNPLALDHFRDVAYAYSGGITDFLVRLNIESQLIALRCGEKEVLPKHVNSAFMSARLAPNHTLISGLVKKDPNTLRKCTDIPVERFLEIWLKLEKRKTEQESKSKKGSVQQSSATVDALAEKEEPEETKAAVAAVPTETAVPQNQKKGHPLVKRFKAEQTREATKRKRADDQLGRFTADDIRGEGVSTSLVAGLKDLLHSKKKT
jgi:hypothetical protein